MERDGERSAAEVTRELARPLIPLRRQDGGGERNARKAAAGPFGVPARNGFELVADSTTDRNRSSLSLRALSTRSALTARAFTPTARRSVALISSSLYGLVT